MLDLFRAYWAAMERLEVCVWGGWGRGRGIPAAALFSAPAFFQWAGCAGRLGGRGPGRERARGGAGGSVPSLNGCASLSLRLRLCVNLSIQTPHLLRLIQPFGQEVVVTAADALGTADVASGGGIGLGALFQRATPSSQSGSRAQVYALRGRAGVLAQLEAPPLVLHQAEAEKKKFPFEVRLCVLGPRFSA